MDFKSKKDKKLKILTKTQNTEENKLDQNKSNLRVPEIKKEECSTLIKSFDNKVWWKWSQ